MAYFVGDMSQVERDNVEKSCHRLKGTFEDQVNWVERRVVSPDVGSQGDCAVCWAWCAAKGVEAAFACAGKMVPPLSAQYVVDHTYPNLPGCRGGEVVAALDLIAQVGIAEESKYYDYTGFKNGNVKVPPEMDLFKIDGWSLIKDSEEEMVAALEIQPLIVSIPYASGVVSFSGEGLLDIIAAEKHNIPQLLPDVNVVSHSVLVVGHGTFISETSCRGVWRIGYWIIKNQWKETWANKGFGYLIKNSSLIEMKAKEIGRELTEKEKEDETWCYAPVIPAVGYVPPPVHVPHFTVEEMVDFIKGPRHLHCDLLFLLYADDDGYGKESTIRAFNQICRLFEYDEDKVLGTHIITPNTKKMFSLTRRDTIVFLSYKAKKKNPRDLKDGIRFKGKRFNFPELLTWVGSDLSMGIGSA